MKNLTMRNKKAELLEGAKELGIEVNNKMTKQEILILINTKLYASEEPKNDTDKKETKKKTTKKEDANKETKKEDTKKVTKKENTKSTINNENVNKVSKNENVKEMSNMEKAFVKLNNLLLTQKANNKSVGVYIKSRKFDKMANMKLYRIIGVKEETKEVLMYAYDNKDQLLKTSFKNVFVNFTCIDNKEANTIYKHLMRINHNDVYTNTMVKVTPKTKEVKEVKEDKYKFNGNAAKDFTNVQLFINECKRANNFNTKVYLVKDDNVFAIVNTHIGKNKAKGYYVYNVKDDRKVLHLVSTDTAVKNNFVVRTGLEIKDLLSRIA